VVSSCSKHLTFVPTYVDVSLYAHSGVYIQKKKNVNDCEASSDPSDRWEWRGLCSDSQYFEKELTKDMRSAHD